MPILTAFCMENIRKHAAPLTSAVVSREVSSTASTNNSNRATYVIAPAAKPFVVYEDKYIKKYVLLYVVGNVHKIFMYVCMYVCMYLFRDYFNMFNN